MLLDAFPAERQGMAMTLFGLAALIAPVVGPTLGGWITDSYSWRWVFWINVPVGLLALGACAITLRDPDYLTAQRTELRKRPFSFDGVGLSLLVIVIVCWEVTLSKGQEWDWLGDPFWRVQTLVILFAVGLAGLIFWELRHPSPVVNFRPLRERNFAACCIIIFCAYAVLYAASTSLPALLQSLFGYDALSAGLVMSPAGFFAVVTMPFVGRALGRGTDARWVIAAGLLTMAAGNYWMSQMNLDISPGQAVWPRVVLIIGLAMCFAPANVAAYLYTPLALRGAAVGLLSLLRNEGGSVGTSLAQTMQERRDQFHSLRLGEWLDPFTQMSSRNSPTRSTRCWSGWRTPHPTGSAISSPTPRTSCARRWPPAGPCWRWPSRSAAFRRNSARSSTLCSRPVPAANRSSMGCAPGPLRERRHRLAARSPVRRRRRRRGGDGGRSRGRGVTVDAAPDPAPTTGDPILLERLALNLVRNGINTTTPAAGSR